MAHLRCLDVRAHDTAGEPCMQPVLRFDEASGVWRVVAREAAFISIQNPWFVSDFPIREDKDARDVLDVREGQVLDLVR